MFQIPREITRVFVIHMRLQKIFVCFMQLQSTTKQNTGTGKSMSEAFIFASTNPQYDNTSFCFDIQNNLCAQHVLTVF